MTLNIYLDDVIQKVLKIWCFFFLKKLIIIKTMFIIYVNWVWLVHYKAHNNNNNNNNNILFLFLRKEID